MPWKMKKVNDADVVELDASGNPIWIDTAGKETIIAGDTIQRLNGEARANRERYEKAEVKLAEFGDIDPNKAKELAAKAKDIENGKLIEAGKLDEVRQNLTKEYQTRLDAEAAKVEALARDLKETKLAAAFGQSSFVREKLVIAPDLVQNLFQNKFDVRDGKIVALANDGSPLTSGKRMGETAEFDEALEMLITARPDKASLMRGANNSGGGSDGRGGAEGAKRVLTRAAEAKLTPAERAAFAKECNDGNAQLVD